MENEKDFEIRTYTKKAWIIILMIATILILLLNFISMVFFTE